MSDFKWPKTATIKLLATDFEATEFTDCEKCAVSKAARRAFPNASTVSEDVDNTRIEIKDFAPRIYYHEWYSRFQFDEDAALAAEAGFDNTVIRTIELRKI